MLARIRPVNGRHPGVDVRHTGDFIDAELITGRVAIGSAVAVTGCGIANDFRHRGHMDHGNIHFRDRIVPAVTCREEAIEDGFHPLFAIDHVCRQIGHDSGCGGRRPGQHEFSHRETFEQGIVPIVPQQHSRLRKDLVGLRTSDLEVLVARGIRVLEQWQAAGRDFDRRMTLRHQIGVEEVKHPIVAGGMHGFGNNDTAEFFGIGRSPYQDTGCVRLPLSDPGNEKLLRDILEARQILVGRKGLKRGKHRSGTIDGFERWHRCHDGC